MTYNILTFKQFRQHQADLNFLKHKLKKQLPDNERISLEKEIEAKSKIVRHHLNKLHQGALGEQ